MIYNGFGCFRYFTVDSNVLAAISAAGMMLYQLEVLFEGKSEAAEYMIFLKFIGTSSVTLTFIVVLIFLGPTQGYRKMFSGTGLTLHLICPLLSIFSLCFLENSIPITGNQLLWGVMPTAAYGFIYIIQVVFTKKWKDFYGFNIGGCWYIAFPVICMISALLAQALRFLHNFFS